MPVDVLQLLGLITFFFLSFFFLFANTAQVQGLGEEGASMGEQEIWSPAGSWGQTLCFSHPCSSIQDFSSAEDFKQKRFTFAALKITIFLLNAFVQVGCRQSLYGLAGLGSSLCPTKAVLWLLGCVLGLSSLVYAENGAAAGKRTRHVPMATVWWMLSCC